MFFEEIFLGYLIRDSDIYRYVLFFKFMIIVWKISVLYWIYVYIVLYLVFYNILFNFFFVYGLEKNILYVDIVF